MIDLQLMKRKAQSLKQGLARWIENVLATHAQYENRGLPLEVSQ